MSWERQKRAMDRMSQEEREAFIAERNRKNRERYNARMARERAAGLRPPPIKGRPRPTKAQIAAAAAVKEAAEREQREMEEMKEKARKARRAANERNRQLRKQGLPTEDDKAINEFLAQGAQTGGFSRFLQSKEHRLALQLTREKTS